MPSKGAGPTIRHIAPIGPREADGLVADVYRQARIELGVIGAPMTMLSPAPELQAPMWALLRESLLVGGPEERIAKEVVATSIAVKNSCRFCIDAHTMMLHAAGEHELAEAVREGRPPRGHAALAAWSLAPHVDGPFDPEAAARFIGTALVFEFITRLVKVMATNASPHPATTTKLGRSVASRQVRAVVAADLQPGLSLPMLNRQPVETPEWAGDSPVGTAFSHLKATAENGRNLLTPQATAAAEQTINQVIAQQGTILPEAPVALQEAGTLPFEAVSEARLLTSAALTPAAVTDAEVDAWRSGSVSDHDTVFVFAYAVAHAMARIEARLSQTAPADMRSVDA